LQTLSLALHVSGEGWRRASLAIGFGSEMVTALSCHAPQGCLRLLREASLRHAAGISAQELLRLPCAALFQ
jgi:hypothetical protein